ncbi:MAG: hypothetical protein K2Q09_09530 [Phycisphaerales bacterium]|nr:hypothetical protein [Phycisphaerales bacterium]
MAPRSKFISALIGASLFLGPTLLAQQGGHGGGADDATGGHNSGGNGGGGSGGGAGGNSGGGSGGQNGSTAAGAVRAAQDALRAAGDTAERAVKIERDASVRALQVMRAQGATQAEVRAAVADANAAVAALVASGTSQINALRNSLMAGLPATATAGQRNAVTAAATTAVNRLVQRQRSAMQDIRRASTGPISANFPGEHATPEHFPGHP